MDQLKTIKELINQGDIENALQALEEFLQTEPVGKDEAYYLMGNAYRKLGDWQKALNNYQSAIELNPDSPALQARKMVMDILNFYNKDMYNQIDYGKNQRSNRSRHRALQRVQPVCGSLSAQRNIPRQRGECERV